MKFNIKNDLHTLIDDNVFIVLFFVAAISLLGATTFRSHTIDLIDLLVGWLAI